MSIHYFSDTERNSYVEFINSVLPNDPDIPELPINTENKHIFDVLSEGILLNKLIARWAPQAVDVKKLERKREKSTFEKNINNDVALDGMRAIGATVVGIGGSDLTEKNETLCLGLLWQVIKYGLFWEVNQTIDATIDKTPPEQILLRWFNHHLKQYGSTRAVHNFTSDLQDAECYSILLGQIAGEEVGMVNVGRALREKDTLKRAQMVVDMADVIHCKKFISAKDIVEGNPRLNLAFVATLYLAYPNMGPSAEELRARQMENELNETRARLAQVTREKEEAESRSREAALRYEDEIAALKRRIQELLAEIERLKGELAEERRKNALLEQQLAEREKFFLQELENQKRLLEDKTQKHKERKRNYEEIITAIRQEKEAALDAAQKEKLEALDKARREGKDSLIEIEIENMRQLDKIRNMLIGCQKHGVLKKQGRGMGARFKKRYFVLKDNILCYYKGETYAENMKPLGVIYLEQARIYEMTDAKAKKFSFQIVTPKKNYFIAAKTATEMKEWMKEIKLAKKREIGIEAVARRDSLPVLPTSTVARDSPGPSSPASPKSSSAIQMTSSQDKDKETDKEKETEETVTSPASRRGGGLLLSSARVAKNN